MLVVLTETYCNKVYIQITQRDDFIHNIYFTILFYNSYRNIDIFKHSKLFFVSWLLEEFSILLLML